MANHFGGKQEVVVNINKASRLVTSKVNIYNQLLQFFNTPFMS